MKFGSLSAAAFAGLFCVNVYAAAADSAASTAMDARFSEVERVYEDEEEFLIEPALGVAVLGSDHPHTVPYASAINPEYLANGPIQERIYDGLLPGDGFTITMDSFPDQNGSTECVQLLKSLMAAPRTIFWKEGRRLKEHFDAIKPGTAIATFVNGQYPQTGRTGMHAAIFVRATQAGIFVLDQFRGRKAVTERFIPWISSSAKRSNNAVAYSTVEW
jgi:hypothetical protein